MTTGRPVLTEWGPGVVTADSPRRVVITLDAAQPGGILNIAKGTPGYGRLVALNRKGVTL